MKKVQFVGLDVHADTIAVAVAEPDGTVRSVGVIPNRPESIRKLVKRLGSPEQLRACYEAGPTGYVLYWQLTALGVRCEVVAPTLVPVKAGDRVKTATPAPMRAVIAALQALRGVAQVSAATIVAELGQVSRFGRPRQLMSYSGTVASEHSSGDRIRRGGITKTGNAHLRRIVIEAAWAYRHRPARGRALLKRQQPVSEEVKAIAWKAQHRLHARYRTLTARGKSKQQVVTAVGRELLGFIWAIGTTVEAEAGRTRPVAA